MIVHKTKLTPIDFHGLSILDFTAGIQGVSSSFAVIDVPPGVNHVRAKSNRSEKLYYVERGTVRFELDGNENTLAEGDFCLVKQGQLFAYRNDRNATAKLILVHTPPFDPEAEVFV